MQEDVARTATLVAALVRSPLTGVRFGVSPPGVPSPNGIRRKALS